MNFSHPDRIIWKADLSNPFQFAPATGSMALSQFRQAADRRTLRNDLDLFDFSNDFEFSDF
jgi:hypothetical protein